MRTPVVTTNEKLRRSSQVKTQVTRYAYNEYMVHQYAFVMKVAAKQEPERPSLHHSLEGENRPNRGKEIREEPRRRATEPRKNHATKTQRAAKSRAKKPRKEAAQQSREENREEKTQAEARTSQLHTTQARTQISQCRCESKRTSDTIRNRPDLSLRGRVENQAQMWSSV